MEALPHLWNGGLAPSVPWQGKPGADLVLPFKSALLTNAMQMQNDAVLQRQVALRMEPQGRARDCGHSYSGIAESDDPPIRLQAEHQALLQRCEALQRQVASRVDHRAVRVIVAVQAALWIGLGLTERYLLGI